MVPNSTRPRFVNTGTVQHVLEWGGGVKLDEISFFGGGDAWEFLFDCSTSSDRECFYNDKTITIFPHHQ